MIFTLTILQILFAWTVFTSIFSLFFEREKDNIFYYWHQWLDVLPIAIAKPLGSCIYCFSTQLHIWGGILIMWITGEWSWLLGVSSMINYFVLLKLLYYWGDNK